MFSLVHWAICILSVDYKTMIMRAGARVENVVDQKSHRVKNFWRSRFKLTSHKIQSSNVKIIFFDGKLIVKPTKCQVLKYEMLEKSFILLE